MTNTTTPFARAIPSQHTQLPTAGTARVLTWRCRVEGKVVCPPSAPARQSLTDTGAPSLPPRPRNDSVAMGKQRLQRLHGDTRNSAVVGNRAQPLQPAKHIGVEGVVGTGRNRQQPSAPAEHVA